MAKLIIENTKEKIKCIITDRDDQSNEIRVYYDDELTKFFKCRLEYVAIPSLYEILKECMGSKRKDVRVCYPDIRFSSVFSIQNTSVVRFQIEIFVDGDEYETVSMGYMEDITINMTV